MFARHYVNLWNAENDPVFGATKDRINKRLAHITIERLEVQSDWPELDEMSAAIEKLICKFEKNLSAEKAVWFPRIGKSTFRGSLGRADNSTVS